jgi:hypothetical protein
MSGERGNLAPVLEEPDDGDAFFARNPWTQRLHRRNDVRHRAGHEHEGGHRDEVLQGRELLVNSFEHQNWK